MSNPERVTKTSSAQSNVWARLANRHAAGGVAILGGLCALLIAVAFLAARHAPSAATGLVDSLPVAVVSANAGCENFGRYWTDTSGAGIDPVPLELFTNCRIQDDGSWVAASSMFGATPIDDSSLTVEQRTQLEELRATISTQVAQLEGTLPLSVQRAFEQLHTVQSNAVVGHFREGIGWNSYRTRYARVVNAFLLDPAHAELASFIGWIMERKMDGYADFRNQCLGNDKVAMLQTACTGMEDNLSIRYAPLPWDLRDPALLDTWFSETVLKPAQTEG